MVRNLWPTLTPFRANIPSMGLWGQPVTALGLFYWWQPLQSFGRWFVWCPVMNCHPGNSPRGWRIGPLPRNCCGIWAKLKWARITADLHLEWLVCIGEFCLGVVEEVATRGSRKVASQQSCHGLSQSSHRFFRGSRKYTWSPAAALHTLLSNRKSSSRVHCWNLGIFMQRKR